MKDILITNLAYIIMIVLFLIMGIAIGQFKWYWLISGYNTASKEEKANVEIEQVAKHITRMSYIIVALNLIAFILGFFIKVSMELIMVLTVAIAIGYAIYIQRFDHNKRSKAEIIATLILIITILFVVIGPLFYMGFKANDVTINENNSISISGMYKTTITSEDIKDIELVDNLPKIVLRSNGFAVGKTLKGYFRDEDNSKIKLYIENSEEGPFIKIDLEKSDIYINYKDKEETLSVYDKLKELESR